MTGTARPDASRARPGRLSNAYWRQWTASAVSNLGDGMNAAALPLLSLTLTDDARLVAAVSMVAFLPWLLLSLPVGVYVDRYDRRRVMVVVNLVRAALFTVIAVAAATGTITIWGLLGLMLLVGTCEVFFDNAAQSFLPTIVPAELLPRANGHLYSAEIVANVFLGLPLGAWLFVVAVGLPFGIDAATFTFAAMLVLSIRVPRAGAPAPGSAQRSFGTELKAGFSWLWAQPLLRTLAIMLGISNLGFQVGQAIFVKFAADELGVSPGAYGVLLAVITLGGVIGGVVGDRLARLLGTRASLVGSYAMFGLGELGIAVAPTAWAVGLIGLVQTMAIVLWNVVTVSLRQRIVPDELLGRVNSVYRWLGWGTIPIGALIGGIIAEGVGLRAAFVVGGAITLGGLVIGAPYLSRWRVDATLAEGPLARLGALTLSRRV